MNNLTVYIFLFLFISCSENKTSIENKPHSTKEDYSSSPINQELPRSTSEDWRAPFYSLESYRIIQVKTTYNFKDTTPILISIDTTINTYDESDRILCLDNYKYYQYDTTRRLTKVMKCGRNNCKFPSTSNYYYNEKNLLIKTDKFYKTPENATIEQEYEYDNQGLLVKEIRDFGQERKTTINIFYKDTVKIKTVGKSFNDNSNRWRLCTTRFYHNERQQLIRTERQFQDEDDISITRYKYEGNIETQIDTVIGPLPVDFYKPNSYFGGYRKVVIEYNDKKNPIRKLYYSSDYKTLHSKTEYVYKKTFANNT